MEEVNEGLSMLVPHSRLYLLTSMDEYILYNWDQYFLITCLNKDSWLHASHWNPTDVIMSRDLTGKSWLIGRRELRQNKIVWAK